MSDPHDPATRRRADPGSMLPLDSDTEVSDTRPSGPARPIHLRSRYIGLVFAGGTAGTAAREALSLVIPSINGIPVAILLINVVGALFLGVLLEALARRGADEGRRRILRLLLGTGFAGGFTTYSALASDTVFLLIDGDTWVGLGYAITTIAVGALATLAGISLAAAHHRRRHPDAAGEGAS